MKQGNANNRDCPHGRQKGKCETCDLIELEKECERLLAQNERLFQERHHYENKLSAANAVIETLKGKLEQQRSE